MRKDITIAAEPRQLRGKNEARRLRAAGNAPAIIYGAGGDPVSVAVSPKEVNKILHSSTGHNTIFDVAVSGGASEPVMIVDWQYDPIKNNLLHIDMQRIDLGKKIKVKVPVHIHGDAKGVKLQGGLLEVIVRELEVECLPDDIPEFFDVDVAQLMIGQNVRASDLPYGEKLTLVSSPDLVLVHVISVKAEEVPAAEAVATTPEPEVAKKGKKEEAAAPAPGADKDKDKDKKKK